MAAPSFLSDALLAGLGRIVVQWAHIEGFVAEIISRLLMADRGSMYVVTTAAASSTQIKWARTLVGLRFVDGDTKINFLNLLDDLDEIRTDRNTFVHGLWGPSPEPDTALVQTTKLDRTELIKSELVSLSELDELSSEMGHAISRLSALIKALDNLKLVPVAD